MTEFQPFPESSGSLEPPRRVPPTAVGAATPSPLPPPWPSIPRGRARTSPLEATLLLVVGVPLLTAKLVLSAARKLVNAGR